MLQAYRRVEAEAEISQLGPGSARVLRAHRALDSKQHAHLTAVYRSESAANCRESAVKRFSDIVIAVVLLLFCLPAVAIIAVAIKITSPGPILFRQRRLGLKGRPFVMFKFRTMRDGASDAPHRAYVSGMVNGRGGEHPGDCIYKLRNDDRVTAAGRFLRRTSLDELPQLLNVLRGEMSVVGPRPAIDYEIDLYQPWQFERLAVRPGITGRWQVYGRNRLTYCEMCQRDVEYVRTWNLRQDLLIMVRTPWVMLSNSGGAS